MCVWVRRRQASGVKQASSVRRQASNKDRDQTGMEWTWSGHGADMEWTVDMEWTGSGVDNNKPWTRSTHVFSLRPKGLHRTCISGL
jgi:hypothetical protein